MPPLGTFETCQRTLKMSAYRGRPEVIGARVRMTRLTLSRRRQGLLPRARGMYGSDS